jgi:hypothetical protein
METLVFSIVFMDVDRGFAVVDKPTRLRAISVDFFGNRDGSGDTIKII